MGIEAFYLNLHLREMPAPEIFSKYDFLAVDASSEKVSLSGALVSFLPACEAMYRICLECRGQLAEIESHGERHTFDFDGFPAFFAWMYTAWEDKLCYFEAEWGAFALRPDEYYKTRRKLLKYYQKLHK